MKVKACIMNLRDNQPRHPWDFRVDRSTPLGNPYIIGLYGSRNDVCDKYGRNWIEHLTRLDAAEYFERIVMAAKKYGEVRLFCWCAPKRCHAETIKRAIEKRMEMMK